MTARQIIEARLGRPLGHCPPCRATCGAMHAGAAIAKEYMTTNTRRQRLLDAVEAGRVGQFRNLDSEFGHGNGIHAKRAYNGSLDAPGAA